MNDKNQTPDVTSQNEDDETAEDKNENMVDTTPLTQENLNEIADLKHIIAKNKEKNKNQETKQGFINYVVRCELGAERPRNEDSCFAFASSSGGSFPISPFGLFVVADGMGGHKNGHIASNIAARITTQHILNQIYQPIISSYSSTPNLPPINDALESAVQEAHVAIYENDPETDTGTTVTIGLILGRRLYVAHVGDSRLYFKTDDKFEIVTKDHTLVQRLKDVGQFTEAAQVKYGSMLIRAVGQGDELDVDTYMRLLPQNGRILLCSDGLYGFVPEAYIEEMLSSDIPIHTAANQLYEKSMEAGGHDNITVIIVDFTL